MDQLRLTVDASIINAASPATTASAPSPVQHGAGDSLTTVPLTNSLVTDESSYVDGIYDVCLEDSQDPSLSDYSRYIRTQAFDTMLQNADGEARVEISLLSTTGNHSTLEPDLGEF